MHIYKDDSDHLYIETSKDTDTGSKISELDYLSPNTSNATSKAHLPIVLRAGNSISVNVEELFHPLIYDDRITTVFLETEHGGQYRKVNPATKPVAHFTISMDDSPKRIYAYCAPHGLWKYDF